MKVGNASIMASFRVFWEALITRLHPTIQNFRVRRKITPEKEGEGGGGEGGKKGREEIEPALQVNVFHSISFSLSLFYFVPVYCRRGR